MREPRSSGFETTTAQVGGYLVLEIDERLRGLDVDEDRTEVVIADRKGLEVGTDSRLLVLWDGIEEHVWHPGFQGNRCKRYVG